MSVPDFDRIDAPNIDSFRKAVIRGTNVHVSNVAGEFLGGKTMEELVSIDSRLTLDDVYQAVAYTIFALRDVMMNARQDMTTCITVARGWTEMVIISSEEAKTKQYAEKIYDTLLMGKENALTSLDQFQGLWEIQDD